MHANEKKHKRCNKRNSSSPMLSVWKACIIAHQGSPTYSPLRRPCQKLVVHISRCIAPLAFWNQGSTSASLSSVLPGNSIPHNSQSWHTSSQSFRRCRQLHWRLAAPTRRRTEASCNAKVETCCIMGYVDQTISCLSCYINLIFEITDPATSKNGIFQITIGELSNNRVRKGWSTNTASNMSAIAGHLAEKGSRLHALMRIWSPNCVRVHKFDWCHIFKKD